MSDERTDAQLALAKAIAHRREVVRSMSKARDMIAELRAQG